MPNQRHSRQQRHNTARGRRAERDVFTQLINQAKTLHIQEEKTTITSQRPQTSVWGDWISVYVEMLKYE